MGIFRKLFKKKKPKKILECETLEEFIEKYKKFHKTSTCIRRWV